MCLAPGKTRPCVSIFLEHTLSGRRNPESTACSPDYAPFSGKYYFDAIRRFGANLTFRDASGLARFPVQGPELGESRVVISLCEPQDHFTRRLVIPEIRLSDWQITD